MTYADSFSLSCPAPQADHDRIQLAHGGGGRATRDLIDRLFLPAFDNAMLGARHDGASIDVARGRLAFTTDSYVVKPLFFPGGDIGRLAVNGTVNDLAMCGARPRALSVGLIIEEGFAIHDLEQVIASMKDASAQAGVNVVTGDTKVVEKGSGDGLFINTSGIGEIPAGVEIAPQRIRPGDVILLSGDIGVHGICVLAAREDLGFEGAPASDTAPLLRTVLGMLDAGLDLHCLRDITRGGLATALIELASDSSTHFELEESAIMVSDEVRAACEILGLDPLYVASEGRFVAILPPEDAERALRTLRSDPLCPSAAVIGRVRAVDAGATVSMSTIIGSSRAIDMLSGEQLPRIC